MGVRLSPGRVGRPGFADRRGNQPASWRCALVNNMPDGAFEATERQFVGLLDAGSGCETIEVSRHTMAGVPRGDRATDRIAEEYATDREIIENPPDLLIVTGSNPLEAADRGRTLLGGSGRTAVLGARQRAVDAVVLPVGARRPGGVRRHRTDQIDRQVHRRLSSTGRPHPSVWPPARMRRSSCPTPVSTRWPSRRSALRVIGWRWGPRRSAGV